MSVRASKHRDSRRNQSNFTDYEPNRRRGSSDSRHRSERSSSSDRVRSKRRRGPDGDHGRSSKRRRSSKERDNKRAPKEERDKKDKETEIEDAEYRKRVEEQLKSTNVQTEEEKRIARQKRIAAIMAKHKKSENTETGTQDETTQPTATDTKHDEGPKPMDIDPPAKQEEKSAPEQAAPKEPTKPKKPMFDLFSDDPEPVTDLFAQTREDDAEKTKKKGPDPAADKDGYFKARVNDVIGGKYKIVGFHGKGMFGNVLRAENTKTGVHVAIKFLRANDVMKRSGASEIKFLEEIRTKDPKGEKSCVLLLDTFQERGHLCLVFEDMAMNLRQFRKTRKGGLAISYVRAYAFRLLNALVFLEKIGAIHADLKPDNILVSKDTSTVKLADFGSAMNESQVEVTPLLVSRYYRAPEIILGMKYDTAIDMFALGATIYELAVGKPLFKSRDNNHHLELIQKYKGSFPKKWTKHGFFSKEHFDSQGRFLKHEKDPADPQRAIVKKININRPVRSILGDLNDVYAGLDKDLKEFIGHLADFIEKCVEVHPEKRLKPIEARRHRLFTKPLPVMAKSTARKEEAAPGQ